MLISLVCAIQKPFMISYKLTFCIFLQHISGSHISPDISQVSWVCFCFSVFVFFCFVFLPVRVFMFVVAPTFLFHMSLICWVCLCFCACGHLHISQISWVCLWGRNVTWDMPCITLKVFGSLVAHLFLLPSKYLQCGGACAALLLLCSGGK